MDKNIGTLAVDLIANISKFKSAMDKAEGIANSTTTAIASKLTSVGSSMMKTGGILTGVITTPLLAFGGLATDAASDLNESMSKVNVVFGTASLAVQVFANNAAKNLGLSKQAALEASGTFGNLFTSMGMAQTESAEMSMNVVKLASDLASFNNLDPTDVLEKLRSGLTGETEPLKSLGINISQAMVEAKAMELGLAGVDGSLSTAAITQARYALILDQTKNAQGDFARTSDGLANQTRIAKAEFENLKATLGAKLLPVANKLMGFAVPLLDKLTKLSPATKNWVVGIAAAVAVLPLLVTGIGGIVSAVGTLIAVFSSAFAPIILGVLAVVAVGALLYVGWKKNFLGMRKEVNKLLAVVQPVFKNLKALFIQGLPVVLASLSTAFQSAVTQVGVILSSLWTTVQPLFSLLFTWLKGFLPDAASTLASVFSGLFGIVTGVLGSIWSSASPLLSGLASLIGTVLPVAVRILSGIWTNVLLPAFSLVWGFLKTSIFPLLIAVANFVGAVFGLVFKVFAGILTNFVIPALKQIFTWLGEKLQPVFEAVGKFINEKLKPAFDGLGEGIQKVIDFIKDLTDKIKNIKLPKWLTPGSPFPLTIAMQGLGDAIKEVNKNALNEFSTNLNVKGNVSGLVPSVTASSSQNQNNFDYDLFADAVLKALTRNNDEQARKLSLANAQYIG